MFYIMLCFLTRDLLVLKAYKDHQAKMGKWYGYFPLHFLNSIQSIELPLFISSSQRKF